METGAATRTVSREANSELTPASSGRWMINQAAAYRRLGGEKQRVLVDAGDIGRALHYQPHSGDRQGDGFFVGRRLFVFVGIILRHLHGDRAPGRQAELGVLF